MADSIIYQCDAHQASRQQAAERFAATWFAEPRELDGSMTGDRFRLRGGVADYEVRFVPPVPGKSVAMWQVWRLGVRHG